MWTPVTEVHPGMRVTTQPRGIPCSTVSTVVIQDSKYERNRKIYFLHLEEGSFFAVQDNEKVWVSH